MTHLTFFVEFKIPGLQCGTTPTQSMWIKIFCQKLCMKKMQGNISFLIKIVFLCILTSLLIPLRIMLIFAVEVEARVATSKILFMLLLLD